MYILVFEDETSVLKIEKTSMLDKMTMSTMTKMNVLEENRNGAMKFGLKKPLFLFLPNPTIIMNDENKASLRLLSFRLYRKGLVGRGPQRTRID